MGLHIEGTAVRPSLHRAWTSTLGGRPTTSHMGLYIGDCGAAARLRHARGSTLKTTRGLRGLHIEKRGPTSAPCMGPIVTNKTLDNDELCRCGRPTQVLGLMVNENSRRDWNYASNSLN